MSALQYTHCGHINYFFGQKKYILSISNTSSQIYFECRLKSFFFK